MSKSNKNRERRERVEQLRKRGQGGRASPQPDDRRRVQRGRARSSSASPRISIINKNKETDKIAAQEPDRHRSLRRGGRLHRRSRSRTRPEPGEHTTDKVTYDTAPPSYGAHNPTPDSSGKHIYTDDRPDVEVLVHNLEHGWTIVWYDESVADDPEQMKALEATAKKFDAEGSDPKSNVIIAPWTKDDQGGGVIPDGKHIAFTHWSIHQPKYDAAVFERPRVTSRPSARASTALVLRRARWTTS